MRPYRQRQWVSQSEWRKRKRAKEKARLEEVRQEEEARQAELDEIEKRVALAAAGIATGKKPKTLSDKLWAWGVNSEKHPTSDLGVFPTIVIYLVVVPVLGFLYKLSFTIMAPLLIIGTGLIMAVFHKVKR